jgi:hypothetical protein
VPPAWQTAHDAAPLAAIIGAVAFASVIIAIDDPVKNKTDIALLIEVWMNGFLVIRVLQDLKKYNM